MIRDLIYDGTFEGLLTAIFYAYPLKDEVSISKEGCYTPTLISSPEHITTEEDKFNRVYKSIKNKLSYDTLSNVYLLYLSEVPEVENLILKYLKLCFKFGDNINLAKNNDIIILTDKYVRRVTYEAHRFTGFVRFKEVAPMIFYSSIEPDHNILPLLSSHFRNRFSDQYFIIHDQKRNLALIYNKSEIWIRDFTEEDLNFNGSVAKNDEFESLWKTFFNSTNIKERKNSRLQKRNVPIRYWNNMLELK